MITGARSVHAAAFAFAALLSLPGGAGELRFNRDIRPILSGNCFQCHGPDKASRKAGLRLDDRDSAIGKKAIIAGDPEASEVIARVSTDDPEDRMPPPEAKLTLRPDQIETLRRWIAEGAHYEPHWAFLPPEAHAAPPVSRPDWPKSPIDAFVLARLDAEGVVPAPEADAESLLRRVTLDLTGLPPTLAEMDAFLADPAPDAYERVVDRLLAAPAYGERMANEWLDVARYADTYGYQADVENKVWPWRDWVIRAFNANLPYDQFILWQLAGDLLPDPGPDQVLATAFNRLHRQTNEGGSTLEEFRQEYIADRVRTFGIAFLGMSFECARCHDHKFDPISQREYYSLAAYFGNIDESGMYPHFTDAIPTPAMPLYPEGGRDAHGALRTAVAEEEARMPGIRERAHERFRAWLSEPRPEAPAPVTHLQFDTIADGKTSDAAGGASANVPASAQAVAGRIGGALQFDGDNSLDVKGAGKFGRTQPFTVAAWVKPAAHVPHEVVLHYSKAREDAGSRGWELLLQDGCPTFSLVHFWPGNAIQVQAAAPIPPGTWTHLAAAYDGSSRAAGIALYIDGAPAEVRVVRDNLYKDITYEREDPGGLALAARFRDTGFKKGALDEVMLFDRALSEIEIGAVAGREAIADAVAKGEAAPQVFEYYLAAVDPEFQTFSRELKAARDAENAFVQAVPEIMVMRELPEPKPTYLLERGAYDAPAEPVNADTPSSILPFPADAPRNRLGLAQWLLDRRNPLTARVAVNRYWQLFFGRGLVETQEDFGGQGRPPTHPELLDTLALWFMDHGWDVKALCRLIVTSAVYRQDGRPRPELRDRDPYNELLARGPSFRLSAEQLRDQALAASGLLVPTVGGPSVKPYQPPGLWEDASWAKYVQDHGDALYRRGMYTFWKRTVPPPTMLTFDAGSREVCVARRESTQTPLQSLALLNDPTFVEAARALAERLLKEYNGDRERLTAAFRLLTGRRPDADQLRILGSALAEQRNHFGTRPEDAAAYLRVGESPVDESVPAPEAAAFTAVVQALMNFDAFQVKS